MTMRLKYTYVRTHIYTSGEYTHTLARKEIYVYVIHFNINFFHLKFQNYKTKKKLCKQ